jgi:hypothetical protein
MIATMNYFSFTYSFSFRNSFRSRSEPSIIAFNPICRMRVRRTALISS